MTPSNNESGPTLDEPRPTTPADDPDSTNGGLSKRTRTIIVSSRRLEANRRNAKLSTGPKTDAGKTRSRANATTHGAYALTVNPCTEGRFPDDPEQTLSELNAIVAAVQPDNAIELVLAHRLAHTVAASRRLDRLEQTYLDTIDPYPEWRPSPGADPDVAYLAGEVVLALESPERTPDTPWRMLAHFVCDTLWKGKPRPSISDLWQDGVCEPIEPRGWHVAFKTLIADRFRSERAAAHWFDRLALEHQSRIETRERNSAAFVVEKVLDRFEATQRTRVRLDANTTNLVKVIGQLKATSK